jgi:hypothetical protein
MDDSPTPQELRVAARGATIMAYAVGLAGVAVGTLALRDDDLATAVLLYVVTFGVGACLIGVATLVRAVQGLAARFDRLEVSVSRLHSDRGDDRSRGTPPY